MELKLKTQELKKIIDKNNFNVDIEIDGGINFENCTLAKKAGANILASGSTIFRENKGDLKKNIEKIFKVNVTKINIINKLVFIYNS